VIDVRSTEAAVVDLDLRIPFTFGVTTVEALPHLLLRAEVRVDGETVTGIAAGNLAPKWFAKDPDQTAAEDVAALEDSIEHARGAATDVAGETAFDYWRALHERQREWGADRHPALVWNVGVTFPERAVIDAVCRARGTTFGAAVRDGTLGVDPGAIYDDLAGVDPAEHLPEDPARAVAVRHTVGFDDPLAAADGERPDDGLPWTLAEIIEADGVEYFKVKLCGDPEADAERLRRVAAVVEKRVDEPRFTVDANESYESVADLRATWTTVEREDALDAVEAGLLFVEQPFPREWALSETVGEALADWDGPPLVIDESDARPRDAGRALARGYAGTSYKACKGVFKGLVNACLVGERGGLLSAEDLTTVGPVDRCQDLAVVATLGVDHVERNGHHFLRGLAAFPEETREDALAAHPDLYRDHEGGFPALEIRDGVVSLNSVVEALFGTTVRSGGEGWTPLREWSFDP
jgi:hypothetical protein